MTDEPPATVFEDTVLVRRAPRYPRFLILGAGLGVVAAFIATLLFPIDPGVGFGPLFGYLLVIAVPLGAALGACVAIAIDASATRRAKTVGAERLRVDATPLQGELDEGDLDEDEPYDDQPGDEQQGDDRSGGRLPKG
jgi:hypothetical protein